MSFQVINVSEQGIEWSEGVYASPGYFDEVPGAFAVYQQDDGQFTVEELTGRADLPATMYAI